MKSGFSLSTLLVAFMLPCLVFTTCLTWGFCTGKIERPTQQQ